MYNVLMGSKRSKKSLTTALKLVVTLMSEPSTNILAVRRFFVDHKKSTFPSLVWAAEQIVGKDNMRHFFDISTVKAKDLYFIYKPTGQQVIFHSVDENSRVNSLGVMTGNLNVMWLEEAYEMESLTAFETLTTSITQGSAPFKRFYLTFNPFSAQSWLKARFFDISEEQKEEQSIFTKITTYRDNEFLGKDDIKVFENLKHNNPKLFDVVGNANWGLSEGQIFTNYSSSPVSHSMCDLLTRRSQYALSRSTFYAYYPAHNHEKYLYKGKPRFVNHYGMDWGFTSPTTLMRTVEDRKTKTLYIPPPVINERNLTVQDIADRIYENGLQDTVIYTDRSEPRTMTELYDKGIRRLSKQYYKNIDEGIRRMQNYHIIIDNSPLSKETMEEFDNLRLKIDRNTDTLLSKIDPACVDHKIDAIRYSLLGIEESDLVSFLM